MGIRQLAQLKNLSVTKVVGLINSSQRAGNSEQHPNLFHCVPWYGSSVVVCSESLEAHCTRYCRTVTTAGPSRCRAVTIARPLAKTASLPFATCL